MNSFSLINYMSSDGSVGNYIFQEIGPNGYLKLCEQSIETIDCMLKSPHEPDYIQALQELKTSFENSLDPNKPIRPFTEQSGVRYIHHCLILAGMCTVKSKKESKSRNSITAYKKEIRRLLPMVNYRGHFKLEEGFYDSIHAGPEKLLDDPNFIPTFGFLANTK